MINNLNFNLNNLIIVIVRDHRDQRLSITLNIECRSKINFESFGFLSAVGRWCKTTTLNRQMNEWIEWMRSLMFSTITWLNFIKCHYKSDAQSAICSLINFDFLILFGLARLNFVSFCFVLDCFLSHSISLAHKQTSSKVVHLLPIHPQHFIYYDQQCHHRSHIHHSYS